MAGDSIDGQTGDDGKNITVGKGNRQQVTENQSGNVVNVYPDRNNPKQSERRQPITLDERLDRLEVDANDRLRDITRLKNLVDGDQPNRFRGLLDQISDSTKSDQEWKRSTEKWIAAAEQRFEKLEEKKDVFFTRTAAWLYIVIAILAATVLFLLLTRGQTAGQTLVPTVDNIATILWIIWYG